jgi:hypothetical protein
LREFFTSPRKREREKQYPDIPKRRFSMTVTDQPQNPRSQPIDKERLRQ